MSMNVPPPQKRADVRCFHLIALAALCASAATPVMATPPLDHVAIGVTSPASGVLRADGGCRYRILAMAFNTDDEEPPCTIHFSLTCSPSGNASISASSAYAPSGEAEVYVTANGHCTVSVSAYAEDGRDPTPTASTSDFYFVSGYWNKTFDDPVWYDGAPTASLSLGSGSGSWQTTGYAVPDLGPGAWFSVNGSSHFTYTGTPASDSGENDPTTSEVCAEANTWAADPQGLQANASSASATGSVISTFTETWTKDDLSASGTPLGFTLRAVLTRTSYATHTHSNGTAQGIAGLSPLITTTATATGSDTETVDHETPPLTQQQDVPSSSSGTISNTVGLYATVISTSTPATGITSVSGDARAGNSAVASLLHSHVNQ